MKKFLAVFGLALSLTACANEQMPPSAPVAHALPPKMMLNVKLINLADRSGKQQMNSPYKNNDFNPTIAEALKQWAGDRLQAVGPSGQAIVVIKDASLTAQNLYTSDSIDMWFTRQQGLKYTGHAEVSLEATAAPGFAMAEASATRSVTLPEHPSAEERQQAYYTLLNGLMKDLGQNMDASIQAHMGDFLVNSPTYGVSAIPTTPTTFSNSNLNPPVITDSVFTMPSMSDATITAPTSNNLPVQPTPVRPMAVAMPEAVAPTQAPMSSGMANDAPAAKPRQVMEIPLSGPISAQ